MPKAQQDPVIPFRAGSPMYVAGPTNSGKSYWVYRLLSTRNAFDQPVKSILYCHGVYQSLYNTLKADPLLPPITFKEGLPSKKDLENLNDGDFHVVVIDDLMEKVVRNLDMQELILKYCHHHNITAILISQNIFQPGRYSRTISLNMHIIVLFANKRDESQVNIIARQFYPVQWKSFLEVYREVTEEPHSYLVIDCTPSLPRILQLRSQIFPPEDCHVYVIC